MQALAPARPPAASVAGPLGRPAPTIGGLVAVLSAHGPHGAIFDRLKHSYDEAATTTDRVRAVGNSTQRVVRGAGGRAVHDAAAASSNVSRRARLRTPSVDETAADPGAGRGALPRKNSVGGFCPPAHTSFWSPPNDAGADASFKA